MSDVLASDWANQPTPKNDAELRAAMAAMFAEIGRINARMEQRRAEINRLEAETQISLINIARSLAS